MITYLLDTSVILDVLNGRRGRDALLKQLVHEGHLLGCSSIQVTEVYAGLRPHEESTTEDLLRRSSSFGSGYSRLSADPRL